MYQRFPARSSREKDALLLFAIFFERPVGVGRIDRRNSTYPLPVSLQPGGGYRQRCDLFQFQPAEP
jgi:hypothetical protein